MLVATDLWKSYGAKAAVSGVSLEARPGEIVGLLGPNGAGKSTTVAMLCGIVKADRGTITLTPGPSSKGEGSHSAAAPGLPVGDEASPAKRRIGLVPQDISLFEDLPARANLEVFGALYGVQGELLDRRAKEALELVGLADHAKAHPSTFSGGMKRRLNIACALVHDPDVLVLDEPTVGVDPQSRNAIFDQLESLRARGKALIYTTHYMEEVERLCDRIVVMDHGRVIAAGTREELRALAPASAARRHEVEGVIDAETAAFLAARGITLRGGASLEDVFLHLTGRQLRD